MRTVEHLGPWLSGGDKRDISDSSGLRWKRRSRHMMVPILIQNDFEFFVVVNTSCAVADVCVADVCDDSASSLCETDPCSAIDDALVPSRLGGVLWSACGRDTNNAPVHSCILSGCTFLRR